MDTEWHYFYGCPAGAASHGRLARFGAKASLRPTDAVADQLVELLLELRRDKGRLCDFAVALWLALRRRDELLRALPLRSLEERALAAA